MKPSRVLAVAALASAAVFAATLPTMSADAAAPATKGAVVSPPTLGVARVPAEAAVAPAAPLPRVRHVFVINLENKGYAQTFGASSPAPYLRKKLRAKGQLLSQYFGVAHHSLPNYIAQISGQGPNPQTQRDCKVYRNFTGSGTASPDQAVGQGCVFPRRVRTVANQLTRHGLRWKGYMQSMGSPCRHPALNTRDRTQKARVGDQYAAKHNPFVYFHSIIDSKKCAKRNVDLKKLPTALARTRTTANLTYITPNLCNDGHDSPCVDGRPGGLVTANRWLRRWVPKILASPAYKKNGLLIVTFDEADTSAANSADACCGEGPGPNSPLPGITGLGGGRTGAVLVSRFITPGSLNSMPYNHYSLLRTIENLFGLTPLGYAKQARGFGHDVFG
jgi:phosphatidylinositol-3-phosphatase